MLFTDSLSIVLLSRPNHLSFCYSTVSTLHSTPPSSFCVVKSCLAMPLPFTSNYIMLAYPYLFKRLRKFMVQQQCPNDLFSWASKITFSSKYHSEMFKLTCSSFVMHFYVGSFVSFSYCFDLCFVSAHGFNYFLQITLAYC